MAKADPITASGRNPSPAARQPRAGARTGEAESRRLEDLTRLVSDWVWETDRDFRLTFVSNRVFEVLGLHPQEVVERRLSDIGTFTTPAGSKADLKWQTPFRDITYETADYGKGKRVFLLSGLPVFDPQTGEFVCVRGTAEDITERRQAEAALRASEQRFRDFAESASDWFWTMGPDLRVSNVSDRYLELTGVARGDVIGKTQFDIGQVSGAKVVPENWRKLRKMLTRREPFRDFEYGLTDMAGETRVFNISGRPVYDENRDFQGYRGAGTDITARKRAEDALREAHQELEMRVEERTRALRDEMTERVRAEEKARRTQTALAHAHRVSTMGEMATQLAHELNQPLSAVANYAESALQRLRTDPQDPEELVGILTSISEQAQRAGEIIRRIRGFVRKEGPKVTRVDVPAAIRGAAELFGEEARENGVTVELKLDDALPKALADTIQVQQVVLNLMRNGMEDMLESGRSPRLLSVDASTAENGEIRVTVTNTGNVLTGEVLKQMFDPFFTTKSSGLGMGLSICRSIVDLHGGQLWATSDGVSGTTFHFILSAAEDTRHDAA
ncbi:MAG: PAS domain S-box protein [Rhodospirillales bacterium]|nr:PAS domain S-box protein [Rhodospirillales bacterium]